jgi:hypothetical protein
MPRPHRRLAALLPLALLLPSCQTFSGWDGNFTVLGYTTRPNYDTSIHTIRVPIFKNVTFRQGLEFELTKAVIREIEAKTPWKVVSAGCPADTELTGTILLLNKGIINKNTNNEVREAQTVLSADIVWRDLRTGEILSRPKAGTPGGPPLPPPDAPPGVPPPVAPPVPVQAVGNFIPELGGSLTTAELESVNRLAVQIVSQMELPW